MYCARVHQSTPRCGQFINPGIATFSAHRPRPSGWLRSDFWRGWWWQDCGPVLCHGCRRCDARKLGSGWIGHDKTIKDVKDSTLKILKMLKILNVLVQPNSELKRSQGHLRRLHQCLRAGHTVSRSTADLPTCPGGDAMWFRWGKWSYHLLLLSEMNKNIERSKTFGILIDFLDVGFHIACNYSTSQYCVHAPV